MYPDGNLHLNYETDGAVFFFSVAYEPLNNWSAHRVSLWGMDFPTSEHGYHYLKYREADIKVAQEILTAPSPWAAMRVDRIHKLRRRKDWHEVKVGFMRELLTAKAEQNDDVRECLQLTGERTIVENSPVDSFWGCGSDGAGENMMGKIWMEVRQTLSK